MKAVAIIQARMGASRLPGKMLLEVAGKPAIAHVIERAKMCKEVDQVVMATTVNRTDNDLVAWAETNGVSFFRGDEDDVLDRYYQAAKENKAEIVVRLTGDCPFLDYQVVDKIVKEFKDRNGEFDYVSNIHPPTYPDGLDTEVFSFNVLAKAWTEAKLKSEREHVTPYIWKNDKMFRLRNINGEQDLSNERWTLDTKEDLQLVRLIATECFKRTEYCGLAQVLEIINSHPEWKDINSLSNRNEGYKKSLRND